MKCPTQSLVSVVIPAYNSSQYLLESVESALAQTYEPIEVLVVDDGSTDATRDILAPLVSSERIKYLHQENQGPAAARNLGIRHAKGDMIAFLDADDIWLREKLETQIELFGNEKLGLVYSDIELVMSDLKVPDWRSFDVSRHFRRGSIYYHLLALNFIPTSSAVLRKRVLEKSGLFLEQIGGIRCAYGDDYELWLRVAKISEVDYIDCKFVKYRVHPNQISVNRPDRYRQLRCLYKHLLSVQTDYLGKTIALSRYLENTLKLRIAKLAGTHRYSSILTYGRPNRWKHSARQK